MTDNSQNKSFQRTVGMNQRSSFVSLAEEITSMNKNTVEIITKMNDIVTANDSAVPITLIDGNGNKTDYYMPTVGFLKKEIDKINTNIKRLSGIDSTTNIIDGKSIKKVYTVDINKEPFPISELPNITRFETANNNFFESLVNPLLTIKLDITDKVTTDVNKILSRRYIVKFERNADNSLTNDGKKSYDSFYNNFYNKTDININDFITWYENNIEIGILKDTVDPFDEQIFELSINEIKDHGLFSVIKTESDTLNKKLWYHLNTLTYYSSDGIEKTLSIGDDLILNSLSSSSRWKIKEINTESSNYRVSFERMEGFDAIPIGTNVLSYYSELIYQKNVNISIGFDEFNVLFIKPINTENNVVSSLWSKGTSFYSNDLMLDIDDNKTNNINLSEYYLRNVYDYGKILKDMVMKKIPSEYAIKPYTTLLNPDNFKVVQINKHLTDSQNSRTLRNLHSKKITSKAKISQINRAIEQKTRDINTKSYSSTTESNIAKNELNKLIDEQNKETKSLSSTVSQISSKITENRSFSKFRVRGFWSIPQPIFDGQTEPQHIVQFRVQYRYSSKTGEINPTEGFKIKRMPHAEVRDDNGRVAIIEEPPTPPPPPPTPSGGGTSAPLLRGNLKASLSTAILDGGGGDTQKDTTAYFSNWNEFKTDNRKRYWDKEKGIWYWKVEDIEDADTPNINQIDLSIKPNEKVEIRVKGISEVGWPDTLMESDWSDILTISFPDELDTVLNENEFILKEATQDETLVNLEGTLSSRGVYRHVQDSYYVSDLYYAHSDKTIQSSFTNKNGKFVSLYDYIKNLTDRITELEDKINRTKGKLSVFLHTPDTVVEIKQNETYNIVVELEDYSEKVGTSREYYNVISLIDEYSIEIQNSSNGSLSLLSNRKYEPTPSNTFYQNEFNKMLSVDYNGDMYTQFDYQFVWFSDNSDGLLLYSGITDTNVENTLNSEYLNIGWSGDTSPSFHEPVANIDNISWYNTNIEGLYTTVHPRIYNSSDLVESGTNKQRLISSKNSETIPLFIYFKLDGSLQNNENFIVGDSNNPDIKYRSVKFFIEPETLNRPFEFEIRFNLKQYRTVLYTQHENVGGER